MELPEFFPESLRIHTGRSVLGLDFGTSNTYLVELDFAEQEKEVDYFSFRIKPSLKDQLADLQEKIRRLKEGGFLDPRHLKFHAISCRVDFVCHSVKLEGSAITRGNTEEIIKKSKPAITKAQIEAKQLDEAYLWMLDHYEELSNQPESFARELNRMVLRDLTHNSGSYRTEPVEVTRRERPYVPPDGISIPSHMRKWSAFVREGPGARSPVEFAAALHSTFVRIHPFADGNGRGARLLVNAFLLSEGLPVVVPTIDDRERYIDALAESDQGRGDEFTRYVVELFEESLEQIEEVGSRLEKMVPQEKESPEAEVDLSLEDDPLASVMGRIIEKDRLPAQKIYGTWKAAFETLRAEMEIQVTFFNKQYSNEGYGATIIIYDILSDEKFSRLFLGLRTTKTWFFGLELTGPRRRERFVFFFQHDFKGSNGDESGAVVLHIGRHDGEMYRNLTEDVFQLSEIRWQDGSILFNWQESALRREPLRRQVRRFLAEIIKAFFAI